ncbi:MULTISPECIES: alanine--tRNA ligase [Treponema]|uniref:Alanine--tRNA ligase n=3 Tax=Treponema saccharophilum TaxID=165 RepID=H7EHP2_9SPIR|nr:MULTISPECIES: alanine--tRNA ligase [Treponema]EIC02918.1 alanyl-tRNA synthetase [Treponema saccharophilum DSM 2985]MBQ5537390.1 alanine--tRNA ligase [Treponema sp.]BDC96737.1 alanine--tRNA ligase [Treponema saccharophilum]
MTANELRSKYIEFFKSKNHAEISGQSLIPENDPSVLFTTAGMHPLVPYLLGEKHPGGTRLTDYQKCVRTGDIDEVGDPSHLTCFEMLGNWSLGDYFKKESIAFSYEFLTSEKWLGLDPRKISVTVFAGDENAPRDEEAAGYWKENGMPEDKIAYLPASDNWWAAGPTGPCGPDTEIFYWVGEGLPPEGSNKGTDSANWMEIWNNVFMQYNRVDEKTLVPLPKKNVDTGMGLERTNCILQGKTSVYLTEVFQPIIGKIEELSDYSYGTDAEKDKSVRIIADHSRASVFILGDQKGVSPSNVGAGYVLRRLIRRAVRHGMKLGIEKEFLAEIADVVIGNFKAAYPELEANAEKIRKELTAEENKFRVTLKNGEAEFRRLLPNLLKNPKKEISGKVAFRLYDTFGFPVELTQELGAENGMTVDLEGFKEAEKKHQEASKSLDAGKAKGGLAEQSDTTTKYHTATHLLQQALVEVLGNQVAQKGSNINNERMRFDFTFERPMTKEEIQKVEDIVNEKIKEDLPVTMEIKTLDEAKAEGARALFSSKYGESVKVYTIGRDAKSDWFSKEVCGGPHVQHTAQIGVFKIEKEQSSSAGVRRIRATISGGLPLDPQ